MVLYEFPSLRYFLDFSPLLPVEYHVHIWQVSPQHSCGDTCQIWKWFKEPNRYSHKFKIFALQRNLQKNERSFIWSCLSTGDRFLCHLVCYHNQIGNMNLISIIILVRGWVSDMVWIVRCLLSYMIRRQILTKHYWPRWTHPLSEIHDTTWHENARHITGLCGGNFPHYWPLWGKTTGHLWIPLINASNWKLWSFLLMSFWTSCSRNNQVAVDSRRKNAHVTSQFCHFLIAFKELL